MPEELKKFHDITSIRFIVRVVQNISVEELAADIKICGVLPEVTLQEVMRTPLSVPDCAIQTLPIDVTFKPRVTCINTCVQRFNGVEESFTNPRDVALIEIEIVA